MSASGLSKIADLLGRLAAVSSITAIPYVNALRLLGRVVSPKGRAQIINSLSRIHWPKSCLSARRVQIGTRTEIKLVPHEGEFDFAAILGGAMTYEKEVFEFLEAKVSEYDVIVEIGANVGVFTVFFEKLANNHARVYSFEPSTSAYSRLLENLQNNNCTKVRTFQCAVGDASKIAWFYEPEGHLTNGSLVQEFASSFSQNVKRNAIIMVAGGEIEQLLQNCKKSLIKIDVEGFESHVLAALLPVIKAHHPDLVIEVLPEYQSAINDSLKDVIQHYSCFSISRDGLIPQESLCAMSDSRDCFLTARS